jgi:hypothetical protein
VGRGPWAGEGRRGKGEGRREKEEGGMANELKIENGKLETGNPLGVPLLLGIVHGSFY